jgi:cellulose synthase/poly-beta-1,6-N-acetylglucosamine synthase-like glycosyltransferase
MIQIILIGIFLSLTFLYASWILIYLLPRRNRKGMKFSPNLSIILPTHNEEGIIDDTIKSVVNAEYPNKKEIIVVNDGSTDNTANIVKKLSKKNPQIRLLNQEHLGKAASLNFGVKNAKFDTLVFLDADSLIGKYSLKELVQPIEDKKVAAVSGVIRAKLTKNPLTWFQDFEYSMTSGWRYVCNKINSISVIPGFMAIKKQALKKIGGFSIDTLTEDFDVALNLREAGYNITMSPKAVIYTDVPSSFKKLFSQRFRWGRGTLQVIKKHSDILFSKKFGLLGSYIIPTHIYWYIFSIIYIPSVLYWMFNDYYKYFFTQNNIISWTVFEYFFKWFTSYGMFDLIYKTFTGIYQFNFVFLFTITSFILTSIFTLLILFKLSKPSWKHLIVYFFLFPYNVLVIFIQCVSWLYELSNKKSYNRWEKSSK